MNTIYQTEPSNSTNVILLDRLRKEVDDNLTNLQFGVEELARNMGMSRSQLHRKLALVTGQSVSQFIREYRLQLSMRLLKERDLTAAEVSYQTGFGSPTYFNKCFSEYYGFPPGEAKNKKIDDANKIDLPDPDHATSDAALPKRNLLRGILITGLAMVVLVLIFYKHTRQVGESARTDKSIAILPFKNLSEDQHNEYFSEGVTEAVRTSLSQISELRVISRTSVEQYRSSTKPAHEIARELGVSSLLEGSIQRSNNEIRIDVHLVDAVTEEQVWAKSYHLKLKDVFAIQTEIARQVADELNAKLSPEEKSNLSKTDTKNEQAYDLFLKAIYELRTYTNQGAHNSNKLLSQAIALDPDYARAYAFQAYTYIGMASIWGAELSALEGLQKAKPLIDKALKLDPKLDIAHMLQGCYRLYHDWDFEGAEAEYKLAIVSDHPDGLVMYIDYLNFVSKHDKAMVLSERLNAIDPYYPNSRMVLSYIYNGRFEEALKFSESRLKMFGNYYTLDSHGFLLLNMHRYDDAIVYFNKVIALEGIRYPRMLGWMGAAFARSGNRPMATKLIDELKGRFKNNENGSIAFFIAVIYSALDEKESAFSWLRIARNNHEMEIPWLMTEPQFYPLHHEPEFKRLAAEIGFK